MRLLQKLSTVVSLMICAGPCVAMDDVWMNMQGKNALFAGVGAPGPYEQLYMADGRVLSVGTKMDPWIGTWSFDVEKRNLCFVRPDIPGGICGPLTSSNKSDSQNVEWNERLFSASSMSEAQVTAWVAKNGLEELVRRVQKPTPELFKMSQLNALPNAEKELAVNSLRKENLQKAVNFVLTNNEENTIFTVSDEANCVFVRNGGGKVYINNIFVEQIDWAEKSQNIADRGRGPIYLRSVILQLNGKGVVDWGRGDGRSGNVMQDILALSTGSFLTGWGSGGGPVDRAEITVVQPTIPGTGPTETLDLSRHKRAWAYIYTDGGCTPLKRKTPF